MTVIIILAQQYDKMGGIGELAIPSTPATTLLFLSTSFPTSSLPELGLLDLDILCWRLWYETGVGVKSERRGTPKDRVLLAQLSERRGWGEGSERVPISELDQGFIQWQIGQRPSYSSSVLVSEWIDGLRSGSDWIGQLRRQLCAAYFPWCDSTLQFPN